MSLLSMVFYQKAITPFPHLLVKNHLVNRHLVNRHLVNRHLESNHKRDLSINALFCRSLAIILCWSYVFWPNVCRQNGFRPKVSEPFFARKVFFLNFVCGFFNFCQHFQTFFYFAYFVKMHYHSGKNEVS